MNSKYSRVENSYSDDEEVLEAPITQSPFPKTGGLKRFGIYKRLSTSSSASFLQPRLCRYLTIAKDAMIYLLAFWGIFNLIKGVAIHFHPTTADLVHVNELYKGCDCGDSVAEAISLGCKFDALSMAWLPEHCRDDELTAEFDTTGDGPGGRWLYYADRQHTIEVDVSEVASMGDNTSARVHMSDRWHMIHCIFYWRKQFRTRFSGKIVEPRSDNEGHIKHCGMVLQQPGVGTVSGVALNTNEVVTE